MLEVLKVLKKSRSTDEPDSEGLDGLRVLRSMGRMRSLKDQFRKNPKRVVRDYVKHWEEQLEAEGKPWTWRDVQQKIPFGKYRSMKRVFLMLGEILKSLLKGNSELAAAQCVQDMKAIHQFATDGTWKAAWPLTYMADPWDPHRHGGTETEIETILAYLKTQDELKVKTGKLGGGHQEGEGEKPKGKGKGKQADEE